MRASTLFFVIALLSCCAGGNDAATEASTSGPGTSTVTNSLTEGTLTGGSTSVGTTDGTGSTSSVTESTSSSDGAPVIISFATNVAQISDGESVVFTAVVSDPDGIDDIAGGTLFTQDGAFSYGPFMSAGPQGAYSITLSWSQIDQVESIEFQGDDIERVFKAQFFDQGGHQVSRETSVSLHCSGGGACAGNCVDLLNDTDNCGGCGKGCIGECTNGTCAVAGSCLKETDGFSTCADYCPTVGEACVEGGCDGGTIVAYNDSVSCMNELGALNLSEPCSMPQTWGPSRTVIRCCCSDTN